MNANTLPSSQSNTSPSAQHLNPSSGSSKPIYTYTSHNNNEEQPISEKHPPSPPPLSSPQTQRLPLDLRDDSPSLPLPSSTSKPSPSSSSLPLSTPTKDLRALEKETQCRVRAQTEKWTLLLLGKRFVPDLDPSSRTGRFKAVEKDIPIPENIRVIFKLGGMTMDYDTERVNVYLDEEGVCRGVTMG